MVGRGGSGIPERCAHGRACTLQVSVPPGALDCWVFLSCLEVLQRIEGCCDRAQVDANIAHTVGLWGYATEKVTAECSRGRCRGLCHWGGRAETLLGEAFAGYFGARLVIVSLQRLCSAETVLKTFYARSWGRGTKRAAGDVWKCRWLLPKCVTVTPCVQRAACWRQGCRVRPGRRLSELRTVRVG